MPIHKSRDAIGLDSGNCFGSAAWFCTKMFNLPNGIMAINEIPGDGVALFAARWRPDHPGILHPYRRRFLFAQSA